MAERTKYKANEWIQVTKWVPKSDPVLMTVREDLRAREIPTEIPTRGDKAALFRLGGWACE